VLSQNCISISSSLLFKCRYLLAIGAYGKDTPISRKSLPDNPAAQSLAAGLAQAHKAYAVPSAAVLFVVQDPERNAFDQRWLEYYLLEEHGIQTCRMTLPEIAQSAKLEDRRLIVPRVTAVQDTQEISVVYLRAGYGPGDYTDKSMWEARKMLELSKAIKCPTIITQLAGCKKVQQVLAMPGVLERYIECL
jgi:glutathione synthase